MVHLFENPPAKYDDLKVLFLNTFDHCSVKEKVHLDGQLFLVIQKI